MTRERATFGEDERFRTAVHEAGHAVAALLLRRAPGVVTIEPTKTYAGLARHGRASVPARDRAKLGLPLPLLPATLRRSVETSVVISLAGPAAKRLRWRESGYGTSPDERRAAELVSVLMTSAAAPTRSERRSLERAAEDQLLSDEEKASGVAAALAGDGLAAEYLSFLRAVTAELVDSPEFQRGVERLVPPLLEHKTLSARTVRAILKGEEDGKKNQA